MALRPPLSQTRAVAPVAEPTGGVAFASSDDGLRWSADCQPLQIRHFRDPLWEQVVDALCVGLAV